MGRSGLVDWCCGQHGPDSCRGLGGGGSLREGRDGIDFAAGSLQTSYFQIALRCPSGHPSPA